MLNDIFSIAKLSKPLALFFTHEKFIDTFLFILITDVISFLLKKKLKL